MQPKGGYLDQGDHEPLKFYFKKNINITNICKYCFKFGFKIF